MAKNSINNRMCLKLQFSATIIHQRPRINQNLRASFSLIMFDERWSFAGLAECKASLKTLRTCGNYKRKSARELSECAGAGGRRENCKQSFEDKHAEMRRTTQFKSSIVSLRLARLRVFSHIYDTARRRRVEIEQIFQRFGGPQRAVEESHLPSLDMRVSLRGRNHRRS